MKQINAASTPQYSLNIFCCFITTRTGVAMMKTENTNWAVNERKQWSGQWPWGTAVELWSGFEDFDSADSSHAVRLRLRRLRCVASQGDKMWTVAMWSWIALSDKMAAAGHTTTPSMPCKITWTAAGVENLWLRQDKRAGSEAGEREQRTWHWAQRSEWQEPFWKDKL